VPAYEVQGLDPIKANLPGKVRHRAVCFINSSF
jgi:hypothetical protein